MRLKYPEPPLDAKVLPTPGLAADQSTYPPQAGPPPVLRHDDSLNGEWTEFGSDPSGATKSPIPFGLHYIAKPGRTKVNWALDAQTLNGTGDDKQTYFKMFARQGSQFDSNLSMKVFVNQPAFVTWQTDVDGQGWSLVIFHLETSVPDCKPVEFACSWLPSSLIDICFRTSPKQPSSARGKQYAQGYFPNWHSLDVPSYPNDLRHGVGLYSHQQDQDYHPFLPHISYSAPFDFKVPNDYVEHLTPQNCRFDIWSNQRAVWLDKQLYEQVLRPVDFTCTAFECVLNGNLLEYHIPRFVIVHRNYLKGLPRGTRNPRARDGDIWIHQGHTAPFLQWMARHPTGTAEIDWRLENYRTDIGVNANLDSREWRRCHLPETLSWIHSSSITLIGDILIGIVMHIIGITPIDVLVRIGMIWDTEMANLPNIRDATEGPIYMALLPVMNHHRLR